MRTEPFHWVSAFVPLLALVNPIAARADTPQRQSGTYHERVPEEIVVTALIPRTQADILSGVSVVSGEELARDLRGTIGETLTRQPGVSATSFGPNASRPVLRGLQGERVRILTDGIGSFDVSTTSVDHAVAINPLTAERIEVLRGPAALLYGSSAIGGVVNVIDARIPRRIPDEPVHVEGLATYGAAAEERTVSGKVDAPLGGGFVIHVDGSWSKTDDLRTGGHILAAALRAEAKESDDPETAGLANLKGRLPNSAAETWEVAGALAYISDGGTLGFSVNRLDNRYGVPARYSLHDHEDEDGHEEEHEEDHGHENIRLHVKQTRADMRAEIQANGAFIDRIRLRAGFADYRHQEIEEDGTVGTTFYSKGVEARAELVQARRGGWDGVIGGQMLTRDMHVVGEEKFLPKNSTVQLGLFTLQSLNLDDVRLEAGGRYEHARVTAAADPDLGISSTTRSFDALSFSAGASYAPLPDWRIGINATRTERAPSAEELFARGPHAGTQSFELGNPDFREERSWGVEASLRGQGKGYGASLSVFHNWFNGYIYETLVPDAACQAVLPPGAALDLPCFQFGQADARTYGFEAEAHRTLATWGVTSLSIDGQADYVRASISGSGPAPRIPPLRLIGGVELEQNRWTARAEVEHAFRQERIASLETETPGFTLINASLSWRPIAGNDATSVTLAADNIFDVVARRHASIMKDYAPLAGRDVRLIVRFAF